MKFYLEYLKTRKIGDNISTSKSPAFSARLFFFGD